MTTARLYNQFHGTSATCRPKADGWLSSRQVQHIRRTLCPHGDCACGGLVGERGRQDYVIEPSRDRDGKDIVCLTPRRDA